MRRSVSKQGNSSKKEFYFEQRIKFLETILNSLPQDLVVFDPDHNYLFLNNKAVKDPELRQWLINKNDFDYCKRKNISDKLAHDRHALFMTAVNTCEKATFEEHKNGEVISRNFLPVYEN